MTVTVRFQCQAAPGLARWLLDRFPDAEDRRLYGRLWVNEIQRSFISAAEQDPGAGLPGEDRADWWEFVPGLWVGYRWRDRGFWPWRRREALIVSVAELPPPPPA